MARTTAHIGMVITGIPSTITIIVLPLGLIIRPITDRI